MIGGRECGRQRSILGRDWDEEKRGDEGGSDRWRAKNLEQRKSSLIGGL